MISVIGIFIQTFILQFDIERFTDMYTDLKWLEGKRQQNHTESTPVRIKVRFMRKENTYQFFKFIPCILSMVDSRKHVQFLLLKY